MKKTTVTFPDYSIGEYVLKDMADIINSYGTRALVVGGKTALQKARPKIENAIANSLLEIIDVIWYGGECSYENIEKVVQKGRISKIDFIVGVGGGKAIDTAKAAANQLQVPVFTVPTIASTCAAITKLSVVYSSNGDFDSFLFFDKPPTHCFIDSTIISNAPVKYLWAGIGDTMAKHYECTFASRGDQLDHSSWMGIEISKMCVQPLLQYGEKALSDCKQGINSLEVEQVILNNIISTGLVSMLVEEKYNGALAHSLFYGLTLLPHIEKDHLHGEVVAYGILVQLAMDKQDEELQRLYHFYKKVQLPTCLADIEVENDRRYLEPILEETINGPDMEYGPYKVTKDMVFEAIQKVESINQ